MSEEAKRFAGARIASTTIATEQLDEAARATRRRKLLVAALEKQHAKG